MGIVELETYVQKWWYFTIICFLLSLIAGSPANISTPLVSSNSLHRKVGESVPTLYPGVFIYFRIYMIGIVLHSVWLSAIHSLSVELRDISVLSCNFPITGHPKYDTKNPEKERAVSESCLASFGNQLQLKLASAHTLTLLTRGQIYVPICSSLKIAPYLLNSLIM